MSCDRTTKTSQNTSTEGTFWGTVELVPPVLQNTPQLKFTTPGLLDCKLETASSDPQYRRGAMCKKSLPLTNLKQATSATS
ncbi:hypothetical protein BIW11_04796 [Tropilaelaps mercedesae]|uniref:Uncharacterized protein n=1 Tax=Tropilaelaps mercedesae TaxID=418985 RepID=A0A1V9X1C6_9ACAR|nr:hypothetical protein BIW11_04796 [Tropilaelaps mercedesae]